MPDRPKDEVRGCSDLDNTVFQTDKALEDGCRKIGLEYDTQYKYGDLEKLFPERKERIKELFHSAELVQNMRFHQDAKECLMWLRSKCKLRFGSGRSKKVLESTRKALAELGDLPIDLYGWKERLNGKLASTFLYDLDFFIEDDPEIALAIAKKKPGITVILFDPDRQFVSKKYNRRNLLNFASWLEIWEFFRFYFEDEDPQ